MKPISNEKGIKQGSLVSKQAMMKLYPPTLLYVSAGISYEPGSKVALTDDCCHLGHFHTSGFNFQNRVSY